MKITELNLTDTYILKYKQKWLDNANPSNFEILDKYPELLTGFKLTHIDKDGDGCIKNDLIICGPEEKSFFKIKKEEPCIKLIRDKLKDVIPDEQLYYEKDTDKQLDLLINKLDEEIQELKDSNFEDLNEWADVWAVLNAIKKFKSIDKLDVLKAEKEKNTLRGKFNDFLVLKFNKKLK